MYHKIKAFLGWSTPSTSNEEEKPRKFKTLTFESWHRINYTACVYQIVPVIIKDNPVQWAADAALFTEVPQGKPENDSVIQIPLNIQEKTPELVFVWLQALGPLFINQLDTVIIYDEKCEPKNVWQLSLAPKEQGINFDVNDFLNSLQKKHKGKVVMFDEKTKEDEEEFNIKPTNEGTSTKQ